MAKLRDEVEVGDRNGELQFLHQLPSIDPLQDIGHSWGSILGKQLPQQPSLCTVAPVLAGISVQACNKAIHLITQVKQDMLGMQTCTEQVLLHSEAHEHGCTCIRSGLGIYSNCDGGSVPGHQPGVDIWHEAQIAGVHKDHATAGDGGWRGILQVTHLQCGMCDIQPSKMHQQ